MVQQTKVADRNRNGASDNESQGLARDVRAFANDVLTLTELQSQLLVADLRECSRRAWAPSLCLVGALGLGLACFPIALVTVALGIVRFLDTSHFTALLVALIGGAICSLVMGVVGCLQARKNAAVLRRSRDELLRNLRWIKQVIAHNRLT